MTDLTPYFILRKDNVMAATTISVMWTWVEGTNTNTMGTYTKQWHHQRIFTFCLFPFLTVIIKTSPRHFLPVMLQVEKITPVSTLLFSITGTLFIG